MSRNFVLIAGHDVRVKEIAVNRAYYRTNYNSPVIRSQCFNEPMPLDCELHKCFSGLPTLLGGIDG